jgi:hypothetical protein
MDPYKQRRNKMSDSVSKVTDINVEILGRRLSFTYDEAMTLMGVLRDAFGEPCDRRYVAPPVAPPVYGSVTFRTEPMDSRIEYWCNPDTHITG